MTIEAKWHYGHFIDLTVNAQCSLPIPSKAHQSHFFLLALVLYLSLSLFVLASSLVEPEIHVINRFGIRSSKKEDRIWQATTQKIGHSVFIPMKSIEN